MKISYDFNLSFQGSKKNEVPSISAIYWLWKNVCLRLEVVPLQQYVLNAPQTKSITVINQELSDIVIFEQIVFRDNLSPRVRLFLLVIII